MREVSELGQIDFEGRVAVVTGAGGGLGRSHALLLASRGAKVVVNDLGVDRHGGGGGQSMADQVVQEIHDAGGQAVANYNGVHTPEGGQAIIRTALDEWGRIDIVVNNAGILRDASFMKLTEESIDLVLKVHLYGAFFVSQAAWPSMREQGYGRIVNTTSGSGLYGNFGQSNYAAAKMGLVGLTRTLAQEGLKYHINCNAIAPIAASRMTADILAPELFRRLEPRYVSPLVGYLASEACTDTGHLYSAGGGYYSRVAVLEGQGAVFDALPSLEDIAERWDDIQQIEGAREFSNLNEATFGMMRALGADITGQP